MIDAVLVNSVVVLSLLLSAYGIGQYARQIISGDVTPNLVSWSVWTIAPLVGGAIAFNSGRPIIEVARTLAAGTFALLICLLTILMHRSPISYREVDIICGSLAYLSLGIWCFVGAAKGALILALGADILAIIPTVAQCWREPDSESMSPYLTGLSSALLALAVQRGTTFDALAFPIYFVALNLVVVGTLGLRRGCLS